MAGNYLVVAQGFTVTQKYAEKWFGGHFGGNAQRFSLFWDCYSNNREDNWHWVAFWDRFDFCAWVAEVIEQIIFE